MFCESKYLANSPYEGFLEFSNSFSSIALILCALIPSFISNNHSMIYMAKSSLFLTGIGSFMFHKTGMDSWKFFDEIPMVFISTFLMYSLYSKISHRYKKYLPFKPYICYLLTFYLFFTIWFDVTKIDTTEITFRFLFVFPYGIMITIHSLIYGLLKNELSHTIKKLYLNTLIYALIGGVAWLIDSTLCLSIVVSHLQLHTIWHIFIAYTTHHLICINSVLFNDTVDIYWIYNILPILIDAEQVDYSEQNSQESLHMVL